MHHDEGNHNTVNMYNYNTILKPEHQHRIPNKDQVPDSIAGNTVFTDSATTKQFLSVSSNKTLSKYNGKARDDINEFIYKLRVFLNHLSIDNYHLHESTTTSNAEQ